jgi:asparagine synthase (glutamine-hydrolysing)
VGLAHKRLAIVDLTTNGHQPMSNSEKTVFITFNGEIYNFKFLRLSLEKEGVIFTSNSDTEVLLKGLIRVGPSFLNKIDGQFAFVMYDSDSGEILEGRDRFGEKPLYMYNFNSLIGFSSELNALEKLNNSLTFDSGNLQSFLLFQYFPLGKTPYKEITKISPGHFVRIDKSGNVSQIRYDTELNSSNIHNLVDIGLDNAADRVEEFLTESLRNRLQSREVEEGAFLSGGIDSSLVVALATKNLGYKLNTFSIGFSNDINSEHLISRQISNTLGTNHIDKVIELDINKFINNVIPKMDEPHGDFSNYPTFELCELASKYVKVAISGDGGDELFSGYSRYVSPLKESYDSGTFYGENYYSDLILTCNLSDISQLFGNIEIEGLTQLESVRRNFDKNSTEFGTSKAMRLSDIENYLPGAVLQKVDRMSMLNSMEVRTPFLNSNLFNLAFNLPANFLIRSGQTKYLLRYLLSRFLDRDITNLPKKGFGLPSSTWGKSDFFNQIEKILMNRKSPIFEFLDRERFRFMFEQMQSRSDLYKPLLLWNLIVLNYWLSGRIR